MLRILFFGSLADQVGTAELELAWQADWHTAADVLSGLRQSHPAIAATLENRRGLLVAVNQRIASLNASVAKHDELAFLPPVTGG